MTKNKRLHLVNLLRWRSEIALIACIVTVFFSSISIIYGFLIRYSHEAYMTFRWFTVDSNSLTGFAALMIIPFAIEGIRKKRLIYPKWMLLLHYSGTLCTTITLSFVIFFISWYDPHLAFGLKQFFLHTICPLAVLISFFMVESNYPLTKRDSLIAMIPFILYSFVYLLNVVVLGTWDDMYKLNTFVPFYISMPLMYLMAYGIGYAIRYIHNRLLRYRERKLKIIWHEELDPVSIKIEVYSLGYHAGLHQEKDDVSIPFDILEEISKTFHIKMADLSKAYTKGVIEGLKDSKKISSKMN
ncbi:MAG: hypothetical protein IKE51_03340 [Solobacterium sp.]|nr:hypothetical protein [Solobacterium sp.]